MSIIFNGTTIPTNGIIKFNSTEVKTVVCNNVTVWSKQSTLTTLSVQNSGDDGNFSKDAYANIDVTNISIIKYKVSVRISGSYRGPYDTIKIYCKGQWVTLCENTWSGTVDNYSFEYEWDVSSYTGSIQVGFQVKSNAASDVYPCSFSGTCQIIGS